MTTPRRRFSLRSALLWLAGGLLLVGLVALAVLSRSVERWQEAIARELAAIEASGAPVTPEDLVLESSPGEPWWTTIDMDSDPFHDLGLHDADILMELLAAADADLGPYDRDLLEELDTLYDEILLAGGSVASDWFDARESGLRSLAEPRSRLRARVDLAAAAEVLAAAEHACDGSRFDYASWIDEWLAGNLPYPEPRSFAEVFLAQDALAHHAVLAALERDTEAALHGLRLCFCAARAFRGAPMLLYHGAWRLLGAIALDALTAVAEFVPDADLSEFEAELANFDPRSSLIHALEGDRAVGHRLFAQRSSGRLLEEAGLDSFEAWVPFDALATYDHLVYLETYALLLSAAQEPRAIARAHLDRVNRRMEESTWPLLSRLLIPRLDTALRETRYFEAELHLVRALLLGRREGAAAARAWIEWQTDPLAEAPFRTRVDEAGDLILWSVGMNGTDEGGIPDGDDWEEGDLVLVLARQ